MPKSVCIIIYRESGRPHMVVKDSQLAIDYCRQEFNKFTYIEYNVIEKIKTTKENKS